MISVRRKQQPINSRPVWPHRVDISFDRLRALLEEFERSSRGSDRWRAPVGLLLGLLTSLIVTDFSADAKRLGLSLHTWELVLFAATGAAVLWLGVEIRSASTRRTLESLYTAISQESRSRVLHRALFIVKRNLPGRQPEILAYFDHAWNCFLLPYENLEDGTFCPDASRHSEAAARFLGLSGQQVTATHIGSCDFDCVKYHPLRKQEATYAFRFLVLRLEQAAILRADAIKIGNTQFQWMTIDDLFADAETKKSNSDVIIQIRKCTHQLLIRPQDSIP